MNKGKILKITENTVYIGYEDGSLKEIAIETCDFEPRMGDYVEVYGDIAIKVEGSKESSPVKKSEAKKISLVSKINIFASIVSFPISFSLLYDRGVILEATILSLCVVSLLLIVLNLILLIISSIKKNEVNKKSSITYLIIAIITFILSTALYVSNNASSNSKKTISQSTSKSSTSSPKNSSITQSNEDDTEKATADFNNYLENNLGEKIDYKGDITLINDDEIYLDTDKIIINNKKYDSKGFKHSPKIKAVYKGKDIFRGGQSLGLNAKVKKESGKPQLEIFDVFTVGQTYEQYMQKGIELKSKFELRATVKEVNKINKSDSDVLTLLIVVEPHSIDLFDDDNAPFQFEDGKKIHLALTEQTEEEFIKQKRGLKSGDDIRIYGTLMTDSLDLLLANQGGSYLDVKRTN
ncbi:hypothetical protein JavanS323_0009 [Streptococcus satellite phage Javan323]|nr:hypothetical protein JavanS323_0009 [Streptococcus satellite phage Javan323]